MVSFFETINIYANRENALLFFEIAADLPLRQVDHATKKVSR